MEIKEIYDLYKDFLDKEIVVKGWIRKHRKQNVNIRIYHKIEISENFTNFYFL